MPEDSLPVLQERLRALEEKLQQAEVVRLREWAQSQATADRVRHEMERRLEEMNNLRKQITEERALYVTRDMQDTKINAVNTRIDQSMSSLGSRLDVVERSMANMSGRLWMLGATLSALVIALNWFMGFFKR